MLTQDLDLFATFGRFMQLQDKLGATTIQCGV
jgi:hypothetical protein